MFCKFCGNELNENAVVCTKCGCAIPTNNEKEKNLPRNGDTVAESSVLTKTANILSYISIGLIVLSFFFWCLSVVGASVSSRIYAGSSISKSTVFSYLWLNFGCLLISFISTILSFLVSTATFIVGLCSKNRQNSFKSNVIFIIAFFLLVLAILTAATHF